MIKKTNCYNIHLTFGKEHVNSNIEYHTQNKLKGYVCVVDFNVLANTYNDDDYRDIVNKANFNTCDGGLLAFLLNIKNRNKDKLYSYNGPEIFEQYIEDTNFKQLLLGPSKDDFEILKNKIGESKHLQHLELPFVDVEKFDYMKISKSINSLEPQIIWVLLGAPKQEKFMSKILPHVNQGLYFGTGAALNFYLGRLKNRKFSIFGLRFIWVERIFSEPKKQIKRIINQLRVFPKILRSI